MTDGEVDTDEFFADLDERPAEDEHEALTVSIGRYLDGDCGPGTPPGLADHLIADGYSKGPRPITDEMVEAAEEARR